MYEFLPIVGFLYQNESSPMFVSLPAKITSMKIVFVQTGRTTETHIIEGCAIYEKRLTRYIPFESVVIAAHGGQSMTPGTVMQREAEAQLKLMSVSDYTILLDENGKELTSVEFAQFLQQRMNQGIRQLAFMVGGSFGFDPTVKAKAHFKMSLSRMTFPHQLIRLIFLEQLYRGFTILRNEPYHHV